MCYLLNSISPCYVKEFKDAALEYIGLNLEDLLANGYLKDLDNELLSELDSVCHDNQMACFPISRGRNSDEYIFEKYPELVTLVEQDKQKRIDSMKIKSRIDQVEAYEGKTRQTSSEKTPVPQSASKAKAPASANIAGSPVLKSKQSTSDLMFQMDEEATLLTPGDSTKGKAAIRGPADGRSSAVESSPMLGSSLAEEESFGEQSFLDGQMASPQETLLAESPSESRAGALQRKKDGFTPSPGNPSSAAPWGSPVLTPSKKDLKDIMAETSGTQVSNLSLGIPKEARRESSGNFTPKLSQKERKKIQQQQMQERLAAEQKPKEAPQNPWKIPPAANRTPVKPEPLAEPNQSPRPAQKPAMTLRQTVAGAPSIAESTSNRSVSGNIPASGPSSSTAAIPFPSPNQISSNNNTSAYPSLPPPTQQQQPPSIQSVRHIPRPEPLYQPGFHTPRSSNSLSLAAILMQQQTEKDEIREAATAKHNLQEIQAEQEFQEWWEKESRRVQGLPDPDADAEPTSQDGRGGSSRGSGRGKGSTSRNNNSGNKKRGGGGSGSGRGRGDKAPASALTQQLSRQRSANNTNNQPRTHSGNHPDSGSGSGNARRGGGGRGGARGRGKERARV